MSAKLLRRMLTEYLAVRRTSSLFASDLRLQAGSNAQKVRAQSKERQKDFLSQKIYQAGLGFSAQQVSLLSLSLGGFLGVALFPYVHPLFVVLGVASGNCLPYLYLLRRAELRADEFGEDFPNLLLATASSMKAGMTVYAALERAVRLLPAGRIVRTEVEKLMRNITRGQTRESAIAQFADSIARPDVALFRSAFLLVLQSGGRFAPTLERLALASRDRSTLIRTANVRCSSMRMTANILLALTPVIIFMVAVRTENYFEILQNNQIANLLGTCGISLIIGSYLLLRRMSAFRP